MLNNYILKTKNCEANRIETKAFLFVHRHLILWRNERIECAKYIACFFLSSSLMLCYSFLSWSFVLLSIFLVLLWYCIFFLFLVNACVCAGDGAILGSYPYQSSHFFLFFFHRNSYMNGFSFAFHFAPLLIILTCKHALPGCSLHFHCFLHPFSFHLKFFRIFLRAFSLI